MTDAPDAGASSAERGTGGRRAPRLGDSGAPIGSTLSIILALIAVVAGFFILREISDDDNPGAIDTPSNVTNPQVGDTSSTTGSDESVEGSANTGGGTGTQPADDVRTGAVVRVANANNVGGSAGQMSRALGTAGYTMGEPLDAAGAENELETSKVYFVAADARAQAVANSLARTLGDVEVAPLPAEIPIEGDDLGRATVLVMLGADAAGRPLDELEPVSTNPAPAGVTTTEG